MGLKRILFGYFLGLLSVVACGAGYKYYGLNVPPECYDKGTLLGPDEDGSKDKPFTICKPEPGIKGKCYVIERTVMNSVEKDLFQCQQRLKDCEAGNPPQ